MYGLRAGFVTLLMACPAVHAQKNDAAIAVVNGEPIPRSEFDAAYRQHQELKPEVQRIQLHCKQSNQPLPVPLLRPSEISTLQDQAIAARNPSRVHTLETIREHLAAERGDPPRRRR